jgi:predicted  nucleic acid-binding Zn-ribbon protein
MDTEIIQALLQLQALDSRIADTDREPGRSDLKKRETLSSKIPAGILDRYNRLRAHRRFALAGCDDGYCSGCQMSVPPYVAERVIYNNELARCEHCGRFLVAQHGKQAAVRM